MHRLFYGPRLSGIFEAIQSVVIVTRTHVEKKIEKRDLVGIGGENSPHIGSKKITHCIVLRLRSEPIIGGHVVVFFGARHGPWSLQGNLVTQLSDLANDAVVFRLGFRVESQGFAASRESLST